jgi:hypothetical protein
VTLFLLALCLGIVAGRAAGGRLGRLVEHRVRLSGVILLAGVAQLATYALDDAGARSALVIVSYVIAGAWLLVNLPGRPPALTVGIALLGAGWCANTAVVLANGAMPVSPAALRAVGLPVDARDVREGRLYKHELRDPSTRLAMLGDTIAVKVPPARVMSLGDLAMLAGGAIVVAGAMVSAPLGAGARSGSRLRA